MFDVVLFCAGFCYGQQNYFTRNSAKFVSASCDGPDVTGECELAYMPGRAVTSRASSGCATGQWKLRSCFVSVADVNTN